MVQGTAICQKIKANLISHVMTHLTGKFHSQSHIMLFYCFQAFYKNIHIHPQYLSVKLHPIILYYCSMDNTSVIQTEKGLCSSSVNLFSSYREVA